MLRINNSFIKLIIISLFILGYGCVERPVNEVKPVEVQPVYKQALEIENNSPNKIKILPLPDSNISPIILGPNDSKTLHFNIQRIVVLEYADSGINYHWSIKFKDKSSFLNQQNGDIEVLVKLENEVEDWPFLIEIGDCWIENNPPEPTHKLVVTEDEPIFGVPEIELCE